jgi:uncharacterized caspase-like protein
MREIERSSTDQRVDADATHHTTGRRCRRVAVGTCSVARGLREVKVSGATLVVFAAKQGHVALDGEGGNSPFAVAVVQRIATLGVEINKVFRLVRDDVYAMTNGGDRRPAGALHLRLATRQRGFLLRAALAETD